MTLALFVVLLVSVLSTAESQEHGDLVNGIFDSILDQARSSVMTEGNCPAVTIPDLTKKYELDLLVLSVSASLSATQGRLSNLMTVRRTGDVTMTTHNTTASFTAAVTLDTLKIVFGHYMLAVGSLEKSGDRLALHVKDNVFDTTLEVLLKGQECELRLVNISVREFSDVTVDIPGESFFNPIGRKVVEWVIAFFNDYIKEMAQTYALKMVHHTIKSKDLCRLIQGSVKVDVLSNTETVIPHKDPKFGGLLNRLTDTTSLKDKIRKAVPPSGRVWKGFTKQF